MALTPFWSPLETVWPSTSLSTWSSPFDIVDPFAIDRTLNDMDSAMRYINREIGRLGSVGGGVGAPRLQGRGNILPSIVDEGGQKKIQYNLNVRGFKPENITLKTKEGQLVVSAKQQEKGEDYCVDREFHRMMTIPEGVKLEDLKSRLTPSGVLQVEAPYNPPAIEGRQEQGKELPIQHEGVKK